MLLPYCLILPKEKKVDFHYKVNRESQVDKVKGLLSEANEIIEICEH
jgi:hypothetical protein